MSDIIEGRNPVIEALKSSRPINKILIARNIGRHTAIAEILHLARTREIPVEYMERHIIDQASTTSAHQGVIAYAAVKEYVTLEDLLVISKERKEAPLYCVLDGIEDPQNLGAILRTAEATGFHGVVIRARRATGLTAAVARASAGAVEYVPVARVANISQSLLILKKNGVWIHGTVPDTDKGIDYIRADFTLPTAIVIGGEGKGLSDLVKKTCDSLVSIPMRGQVSSLNASIAAALVMYEAFRQRTALIQTGKKVADKI